MYAGQVVETAPVPAIFDAPRHPYTEALLAALPEHNLGRRRLRSIPGVVPGAFDRPARLPARAALRATCSARCRAERPALFGGAGRAGALLLSAHPTRGGRGMRAY